MYKHFPVYVGNQALDELVSFCKDHNLERFALIADHNTYSALGARVAETLRGQGWDVLQVMLEGKEVIADARYVFQTMLALDRTPRTFLAVGSGTVTDITRFVSHRTGADFISLPTAPSVDGFTSVGAPMVIDGIKTTVLCHGPQALFADLPTLCAAPRAMIAAGLGDMLAKLTSSADWELTHLLWGDPFDPAIAERSRKAARACAERVAAIAAASEEGIRTLMEGLIEAGFCMLDFGQTLPASGGEHHISHFLEMKLLREGRPAILHGAKVGVGVLINARRFEAVRRLSREDAAARLARKPLPPRDAEIRRIRDAYGAGSLGDQVIAMQAPFLDMTPEAFEQLKQRIVENWDAVQRIAATVPPADQIAGWLRAVGGAVNGPELGLSAEEVELAAKSAHYFKNRITINKLNWLLDLA